MVINNQSVYKGNVRVYGDFNLKHKLRERFPKDHDAVFKTVKKVYKTLVETNLDNPKRLDTYKLDLHFPQYQITEYTDIITINILTPLGVTQAIDITPKG